MRYGIEESGSTQTESVSEDSAITEVTICGLKDTSTYAIEVAAVNSAGTGEYSDSIAVKTDGKRLYQQVTLMTTCVLGVSQW